MAKLNKNIFTICFENGDSKRVYSSKNFFDIKEGKVTLSTQASPVEQNLAWVLENFSVTESGIEFYYDIKANSIKHLVESVSADFQTDKLNESVAAHDSIEELNERLVDVEALRKSHKLSNNEAAVTEANNIISELTTKIQELKKSATYVKYSYVAEENKTYVNSREVVLEGFAEQAFAAGHVSYANKPILNAFEIAAKNFDKLAVVENLTEVQEGDILISTFREDKKAFVYRFNEGTKIKQFNEWSPVKAIDYVAESTGEDLSFMFEDLLESKTQLKERIEEKLEETYELISFLKSQKELFAEANRNIEEIKEAEKLIDSEISHFEQISRILEDDELTKNDGFLDAEVSGEYEGISNSDTVKVDAFDYTSAAKDDMVTVVIPSGKPIKVKKRDISLDSRDSI